MSLIYRIEGPDGKGMYWSAARVPSVCNGMQGDYHPLPEDDSKLQEQMDNVSDMKIYRFGFDSVEQLRAWVYSDVWLQELHDAGFKLITLHYKKESDVLVGYTQVMYNPEHVLHLHTHSIPEYFNLPQKDYDD